MKTRKIVTAALLAALVCVATSIIKIPSPFKGYLNLGDCVVLLCGWLLAPGYAALAAGIGSALADLYLGYASYAAATFVIKAAMALVAHFGLKFFGKFMGKLPSEIISGAVAEVLMVAGYFVFEGFLYGFAPSAVNIPANAVQGVAGLVVGVSLVKILQKSNINPFGIC